MYVYFLFIGYRVAIGRTKNIVARVGAYQRTHRDVFVLGVIQCRSREDWLLLEKETLKRFKHDNDFRDMFFLSSEMKSFILDSTKPFTAEMENAHRERKRKQNRKSSKKYYENPQNRKRHNEKKQNGSIQIAFERAQKAQEMASKGMLTRTIAERLGVSRGIISRDLKKNI